MENAFYEGPLRVRVPVNMQLDADGAFSFDVPLPSAEGALGDVRTECLPCPLPLLLCPVALVMKAVCCL